MKETVLYNFNYHVLAVGFFAVRVAVIPFFWKSFYHNFDVFQTELLGTGPAYFVILVFLLADWQNVVWSKKLLHGLRKGA